MQEILKVQDTTFLFFRFRDIKTAGLGVFVKVGSRQENKPVKGIAHFIEHMLFKGSEKYSYQKMQQEIEGRGGALNGFTSQELTAYYVRFLNNNIKLTLDILLDMVFASLIKEKELEKERQVILEEIKMHNDLPTSYSASQLDKLLWPNHPLGDDVLGDNNTINRIKRADMVNFINDYYQPNNVMICCCGDFDYLDITKLLEDKLVRGKKINRDKLIPPATLKGLHISVTTRQLQQAHLWLGFRAPSYLDKDRFIVELVNIMLGANMSSRLFQQIREKLGLCYDISTEVRKYKDSGAFTIQLGLDKKNIGLAITTIFKEINKIKSKGVQKKELARAKDYMLGQLAMGLEKPLGRMFYLAESFLTLGKIYTYEEIDTKIRDITPDMIKDYLQNRFLTNHLCVSCIGDFKDDIEALIKQRVSNFVAF